jgi:hypothetical protein
MDDYVQVPPNSTGEKIRTFAVEREVGGAVASLSQQVTTLADDRGFTLPVAMSEETGQCILSELRLIRQGIALLIGQPLLSDCDGDL